MQALSLAAAGAMLYAQNVGWLAGPAEVSWVRSLIIYGSATHLGAVLIYLSVANTRRSLEASRKLRVAEQKRAGELHELLTSERKRARQMELVTDIARNLTRLDEPMALVQSRFGGWWRTGYSHASLLLVEGDRLVETAHAGMFTHAIVLGDWIPIGKGIIGSAAVNGTAYLCNDTTTDPHFFSIQGITVRSAWLCPCGWAKASSAC